MKLGRVVGLGLLFLVVSTAAGLALQSGSKASALNATLGSTSPAASNSDPGNGHVHYIRKQGVTNGSQPYIELKAYYPKNVSRWNTHYLQITPDSTGVAGAGHGAVTEDHVCDADASGMSAGDKKQFIIVTLTTDAEQINYNIPADNVCVQQPGHNNQQNNNANNVFFAKYRIPSQPGLDDDTNRYVVDIKISYSQPVPQGDNGIRFEVTDPSGDPKIGPLGRLNGNTSFSVIARWGLHDLNNTPSGSTNLVIPFGLACSQRNDVDDAHVRIYDADNGLFNTDVTFKVREINDDGSLGSYVRFNGRGSDNAGPGTFSENNTRYRPPNGSGNTVKTAWASMPKFKAGQRYQMEIYGVQTRNTIDIGVPGDPIFGVVKCDWKMKSTTSVNHNKASPGDSVVFTHKAENVGDGQTDANIDIIARWGKRGVKRDDSNVSNSGLATITQGQNPWRDQRYTSGMVRTIKIRVTIPLSAQDGQEYCQYLHVNHTSNKDPDPVDSAYKCVKVEVDIPPPNSEIITLTPHNYSSGQTETQENATFSGNVSVDKFPQPEDGGWGYSELSKRLDALRVTASARYDTLDQRTREVTVYTCPSGYSPTHPSSGGANACSKEVTTTTYTCPDGFSPTHPSSGGSGACSKDGYDWVGATKGADGNWSCPSGTVEKSGSGSSKTCKVPVTRHRAPSSSTSTDTVHTAPNSSTKTEYSYKCEYQGDSAWSAYGDWGVNAPTCKPYWTCPGGAVVTGSNPAATGGYYTNAPSCDGWRCQYPSNQINQAAQPTCQYRCSGGTGALAWLDGGGGGDSDPYPGNGSDKRCFVKPSFTMHCEWENEDGDVVATMTATVDHAGNDYCNNNITLKGEAIGSTLCANISVEKPEYSADWQPSNPLAGMMYTAARGAFQKKEWHWKALSTPETCTQIVGYPYLKVYGSDVRVGGGVGATDTSCAASTTAGVKTRSGAGYVGAGAQYAAMAVGAIDGFSSAQYNAQNATPRIAYAPKELSFANTDGSLYGGNWGAGGVPACVGYVSNLPAGHTSTYNVDKSISRTPIAVGDTVADHVVNHDAYIPSNITYSQGWGSIDDIPQYQLVVEGDIYIGAGVTRLDGLYAAIPRSDGSGQGGHIYTCATGIRSAPANTLSGCENQLVVNGALAANSIAFMRDCGSLHYSTNDEGTVTRGGTNGEQCNVGSGDSHAAEVINYSPMLWLKALNNNSPDTYDSISSLPPIL